jgi:hypothetical protein
MLTPEMMQAMRAGLTAGTVTVKRDKAGQFVEYQDNLYEMVTKEGAG